MMLIVWPAQPQRHHGGDAARKGSSRHDGRAAPVAQEQEHHQAGQERAEDASPRTSDMGDWRTRPDWSNS